MHFILRHLSKYRVNKFWQRRTTSFVAKYAFSLRKYLRSLNFMLRNKKKLFILQYIQKGRFEKNICANTLIFYKHATCRFLFKTSFIFMSYVYLVGEVLSVFFMLFPNDGSEKVQLNVVFVPSIGRNKNLLKIRTYYNLSHLPLLFFIAV